MSDHDDKQQSARRKLIKTVALGGGVFAASHAIPQKWTKPVIRSVMLPAHAATTAIQACRFETCQGELITSGDTMTIILCVVLDVDAPESQCQGDPECVLRIGGEGLPPSTSEQNPDNDCQFICCWFYTDVPRLSGPASVRAQVGDTDSCTLSLADIPDDPDISPPLSLCSFS